MCWCYLLVVNITLFIATCCELLCILFIVKNIDPFFTKLYGSTNVLNHMAQGENNQFSSPMNVLSCPHSQRNIPTSSQARSTSISLQQQLECATTSPLLSWYNPEDGWMSNDPPTKKLRTLSFVEKLIGQTRKAIPTTREVPIILETSNFTLPFLHHLTLCSHYTPF